MDDRELLARTASLVCFDVPVGAAFGVDWSVHTVGPAFLGMKLIPPGLHLAVYGSELHPLGFFFHAAPADVLVYRWDAQAECLVREGDEAQRERVAASVHRLELDSRLGPYDAADKRAEAPGGTWALWSRLASHIDELVLERAQVPLGTTIMPSDVSTDDPAPASGPAPVADAQQLKCASFTSIRKTRPARLRAQDEAYSPKEVTAFNFDGSARLDELLGSAYAAPRGPAPGEPWRALLGELQLAYLLLLLVHSHGALIFWKEAVALLCTCERALTEPRHEALFGAFLRLLHEQLEHLPADLFVDELSCQNFLGPALSGLNELLEGAPASLQHAAQPLWALLMKRFGLDASAIAEIDEEDQPVVV
ncbi:A1 cistron-splicing factor [Pavlovales sp. CCMP2436]|nr:A1 cistron-splicing factor [Pavlovales sp. CCMP2436]